MRKFATAFMLFLLAGLISSSTMLAAQEKPKETPKKVEQKKEEEKEDELPTKAEYEKALKHYATWSEKFNDPEYWKDVTLKRVSDGKLFKVKDLPTDFDKSNFYLSNLQRCSFQMKSLKGYWEEEVKEYTKTPPKQKDVPTAEEIKGYLSRLEETRKKTAVRLEAFAEKFVKDFPDKVTKEEGETLLKRLRDFHDGENLIERKKK